MRRSLWLADAARDYGLDVTEVDGWRTRGATDHDPDVIVCHHTASNQHSGEIPSLNILVHGRSGPNPVPGPLANLGLGRSGRVYVVASGTSNNAGLGSWAGVTGNRHTLGIEAENNGIGEPWPDHQRDAYRRLVAALCDGAGIPVGMVCGHKEWAPGRKIDPHGIDMDQFRDGVRRALNDHDQEDDMTPEQAKQLAKVLDTVARLEKDHERTTERLADIDGRIARAGDNSRPYPVQPKGWADRWFVLVTDQGFRRVKLDPATLAGLRAAGAIHPGAPLEINDPADIAAFQAIPVAS